MSGSVPFSLNSPRKLRHVLLEGAMIGLLSLTLNLIGNGRVSLWDRDEPRYAGCTREMRSSGDWIHPTFNAEPRYHKPVLIYWLMLAGTAIGGDNPFGARLVSPWPGRPPAAGLGLGTPDARQSGWAAGGAGAGDVPDHGGRVEAGDHRRDPGVSGRGLPVRPLGTGADSHQNWWPRSSGFLLGLAVLTKSPAGPVLIMASGVASWWWGGPTAWLPRLRWRWGPLLALGVALPWNVVIMHQIRGRVLRRRRRLPHRPAGDQRHRGARGVSRATISSRGWLTFYPWSVVLPAALAAAWARRRQDPLAGFLLGWLIGPLILLECVRTKLIHYYLPAFPAAALLVGWLLARVAEDLRPAALKYWTLGRAAFRTTVVAGSVVFAGLVAAAFVLPAPLRAPALTLAACSAAGTILVPRELRAGRTERAAYWTAGLAAGCLATAASWLLPAAEPYRLSTVVGRKLAALEQGESAGAVLCSFQTPGTIYALGHPAPLLRSRAGIVRAVSDHGKVLTALMPEELAILRNEPALQVKIHETVRGFNIEKARTETIHLAVIRPDGKLLGDRPADSIRR